MTESGLLKEVLSIKMLNNLLLRLRVLFPILPKSYKTLLQTPPILGVQQLPDGSQLWYNRLLLISIWMAFHYLKVLN
ncbi:Uncharacterized protein DBV15_05664 [Temnothorax longispinosus]|uniref:Uncharacterized protein n=1 Tax=Temnothorax longispinosus TaxID=300112 RepID=A0A4S2JMH9_9HYME|nr:Uncharacterized protein DBV15_05664 [Temnothorax longispinosus]